ncbi:hypothetical protein JW933_03010, partial [candidate division FCPU426 bacterium]|nr:hypothetical protein [candidate division FCPU426 bacterium]
MASLYLRPQAKSRRRPSCPFGDGRAADRIVQGLAWACGRSARRPPAFVPRGSRRCIRASRQ